MKNIRKVIYALIVLNLVVDAAFLAVSYTHLDVYKRQSVDSSISFFRSTQGAALTATAVCDKPGRHLGFYTVTVEDDLGKQIAKMTATCYR